MTTSITKIFALAFLGVIASAGVLRSVEYFWLAQPAQAQRVSDATSEPAASPVGARPKIRVGLYSSDETVTVVMDHDSKIVTGPAHTLVQIIAADQTVSLSFDRTTNNYTVSSGDWQLVTAEYIKMKPLVKNTVATITSYSNPPSWDPTLNDNQFFGAIELRYAEATDTVWVINELGVENYVKGVSEAGNDNAPAYLKALYTAARSYVYYLYLHPTKHDEENFLVDTSANDQVYRGYGFTQRAPNVAAAVEATAGQIVYFEGVPVVTPYFSQSDGRTRAWSEVWNGDYLYLQSVDDPGCVGDELLGHGVGMSAKGARYFAETEHWHWREILQYYYQGVTLEQIW